MARQREDTATSWHDNEGWIDHECQGSIEECVGCQRYARIDRAAGRESCFTRAEALFVQQTNAE